MYHQSINSKGRHYSAIVYDGGCWDYHFHNSFELIYAMEGDMDILVNEVQLLLREGEFLLIAPGMVHAIRKTEKCRFFIGIFTPDYVMEFYQNDLKAAYYRFSVHGTMLDYLKENMIFATEQKTYMRKSCLYGICACAAEAGRDSRGEEIDGTFVVAVNQYIADHFTQDIRRKDIADALNYEEHYFSSLFHKAFGVGLKRYLNIYRIVFAQKLLRSTKLTAGEIAMECGFSSVRSFNDSFLKLTGTTPGEYRKQK